MEREDIDGYAVETTADAPMRVRAWFDNRADAMGYAARFGPGVMIAPARYTPTRAVDALREELRQDEPERDQLRQQLADRTSEADRLEDEVRELHERVEALEARRTAMSRHT